jgi:hypothetical protein
MTAAACALGCGDKDPVTPTAPVAVAPTPTPTPAPTSTSAPAATPNPCQPPACEPPVTNENRAVRLTLRLYTVTDEVGNWIQNWNPNDEIPVDYTAIIDATAKDDQNKDTLGEQGYVDFHFSGDTHAAKIGGGHPFQRRIRPMQPGTIDCWGTIDDAQSNTITLNFRRR